ncbi:MAG: HepT-like ribonuclease domain-containing protein [Trueperaceae bacterium]
MRLQCPSADPRGRASTHPRKCGERRGPCGEAARHVPSVVAQIHPDIPWREMRDMRNFVVHEYPGVDAEIVWKTIRNDLPPLLPLLHQALTENTGVQRIDDD